MWWLSKPSNWFALALVLGVLLWLFRQRKPGTLLIGLGAAGLIVGGLTLFGGWLIQPLEQRFVTPEDLGDVEGIIVLAGAERPLLTAAHGQSHVNDMSGRLFTFMRLANDYPDARLVHSGAGHKAGSVQPNQSTIAASLLIGAGVNPQRLLLEDRSQDTCENAAFSLEMVRPSPEERWLLVTSAFHMPRAIGCFRAVGWEVIPYPTDYHYVHVRGLRVVDIEFAENLRRLDLATHEWAALVYYRSTGRIDSILPGPD